MCTDCVCVCMQSCLCLCIRACLEIEYTNTTQWKHIMNITNNGILPTLNEKHTHLPKPCPETLIPFMLETRVGQPCNRMRGRHSADRFEKTCRRRCTDLLEGLASPQFDLVWCKLDALSVACGSKLIEPYLFHTAPWLCDMIYLQLTTTTF